MTKLLNPNSVRKDDGNAIFYVVYKELTRHTDMKARSPCESTHKGKLLSLPSSSGSLRQIALALQRFVRLRHIVPSGHTRCFCGHFTAQQQSRVAASSVARRAVLRSVITSHQRSSVQVSQIARANVYQDCSGVIYRAT